MFSASHLTRQAGCITLSTLSACCTDQHATDTRAPGSERNVNVIEMLGGNAVLGNNRPVLSVRKRAAPSATTGSGSWGSTAVAVVEESRVDHRPGQTEVPRGLCHRRGTEGHRASRRGAKPASHSPTRGDPRYRLGERGTRTPVPGTVTRVSATPTVPAQDREHHDARRTRTPFTEVEGTPHDGHARGVSIVITCTTRVPSGSTLTRSSTTRGNQQQRRVVHSRP